MAKSRLPLGAVMLVAVLTVGCHGSKVRGSSVGRTTIAVPAENRAIAAVMSSVQGRSFAFFPHRVGRARCAIPEGGLVLGRVRGVCVTHVVPRRGFSGQVVVNLTQTWAWRLFHYAGKPQRRQVHCWRFVVLPTGRVRVLAQGGDFPPEWVR